MILRINLGEETSDIVNVQDQTRVYSIKRLRRSDNISLFVVALDHSGKVTDRQEVSEAGKFIFFNVLPVKLRLEMSVSENGLPRYGRGADVDLFVEIEARGE